MNAPLGPPSGGTQLSFQAQNEQFFTLDSLPDSGYVTYESPPWPDSILRRQQLLFNGEVSKPSKWNRVLEIAPSLDMKELLLACGEECQTPIFSAAEVLMNVLEQKVSVSGEPMQRLSAYMLEGLRARLFSSGNCTRKSMDVPHAQSACRPGGPPFVHVTGVDDSQSAHARGGGLQLVGERLAKFAESCGVPFEFHAAAISGTEVHLENLNIRHGEALAVNFPYVLHHMPDESVSTVNHRDRLLRLVKSLSPKIVTLVEQATPNTNTSAFLPRFRETMDYYTAMFESIDAARPRDDKQRISAEEHCVARDVVNIIAMQGAERVERHEL
ncbi:hypothetical protein HAX54_024903 [Datura stramonium]|uniref:Uncharacterized protein n=1 Tax=Datura stramonium TaxID=4076 RepID=A0ABS8S7P0_DATST|nr:hypothetical protein [Datura stramonium]